MQRGTWSFLHIYLYTLVCPTVLTSVIIGSSMGTQRPCMECAEDTTHLKHHCSLNKNLFSVSKRNCINDSVIFCKCCARENNGIQRRNIKHISENKIICWEECWLVPPGNLRLLTLQIYIFLRFMKPFFASGLDNAYK